MTPVRTEAASDRARDLALAAARVVEETRGTDICVLDLRDITPVFDYFVIATGSSRRQMHAMADEVEAVLKKEHKDRKRVPRATRKAAGSCSTTAT